MKEFFEPSVVLHLGGVDTDTGGSTNDIVVIDDDATFLSPVTPLDEGRFFSSATFVETRRAVVVCGGYVGQARVKFAAKRLNLVSLRVRFRNAIS